MIFKKVRKLIPKIQSKLPNIGTTIFTVMSVQAAEHKAINLGQGFPDYAMNEGLIALVNQAMKNGHNQYVHMNGFVFGCQHTHYSKNGSANVWEFALDFRYQFFYFFKNYLSRKTLSVHTKIILIFLFAVFIIKFFRMVLINSLLCFFINPAQPTTI